MVKTFSFKEKNNGSNPFFSTEKEPSENKNLILIFYRQETANNM